MTSTYNKYRMAINVYPGVFNATTEHGADLTDDAEFPIIFNVNPIRTEVKTQQKRDVYKDTFLDNFAMEGHLAEKLITMQGFYYGADRLSDFDTLTRMCVGTRGEKILRIEEPYTATHEKRFMYVWGVNCDEIYDSGRSANIIDYGVTFSALDGIKHSCTPYEATATGGGALYLDTTHSSANCIPYLYKITPTGGTLTSFKVRNCASEGSVDNISKFFQIAWTGSITVASGNSLWIAHKIPDAKFGNMYNFNCYYIGTVCPSYGITTASSWTAYSGITGGLFNPFVPPETLISTQSLWCDTNVAATIKCFYRKAYI